MEPLKEMFDQVFYEKLATSFSQAYKSFQSEKFLQDVLAPLPLLSLNERMRHTSVILHRYLPTDYKKAISIMQDVVPSLSSGYTTLIFPDFVAQFGTHDFKASLSALHYFTRFGSSEFAIRTFLKTDFEKTIQEMYRWSADENEHVRRLSSEGSRPRLPWSFKLDAVIQNPKITQPILENLKQDDALYVRKSVANHINDFSKDSPRYVMQLIKNWDQAHPHTAWIIKRGCRSLLKNGDKASLAAFRFTKDVQVAVKNFSLEPKEIKIGGEIVFKFELFSRKKSAQRLMIDYRIQYVKKGGKLSPKIFKLKEIELKSNASVHILKSQKFSNLTTRTHHKGKHRLEILVNGEISKQVDFFVL
jgi:3-methyladenine DNA glycosylase AlkC